MAATEDQLIRFLLTESYCRGAIIRGSSIFREAARIHGLHDGPAELFGQSLLASLLLLSISKGGIRQVLQIDASREDAPIRRIYAEARQGAVRGYMNWSESQSFRHQEAIGVTAWLGEPVRLSTVRDLGIGQPYISTIEHASPHMADHIQQYLDRSVQIRSEIVIHGETGLLLEAMPGCDDDRWFEALTKVASISNERLASEEPESVLSTLQPLGCRIVSRDDYAYRCNCSPESLAGALTQFDPEELDELVDENGEITISCQYCGKNYAVDISDIDRE